MKSVSFLDYLSFKRKIKNKRTIKTDYQSEKVWRTYDKNGVLVAKEVYDKIEDRRNYYNGA